MCRLFRCGPGQVSGRKNSLISFVQSVPAILKMVESKDLEVGVMVELDPSKDAPMTPLETAKTTKAYLEKMGCAFQT